MALGQKKIAVGQRVEWDEHNCVVLEVLPRFLIVRNKFGFPEKIDRKGVKLADSTSR